MAGMPQPLLSRAEEILATLEEKHGQSGTQASVKMQKAAKTANYQLNIFDGITEDMRRVRQVLLLADINTLTPVEALLKLNELKGIVSE